MDFQAVRKEYENKGITRQDLADHPIELLRQWMDLAIDSCPDDWFEPNAMTLATADEQGTVSARVVLLKGIVERGIIFYTNYESEKGRAMAAHPQVAVALHWPYLGRQIRISGTVSKTSHEQSEEYFHSRPRGSQIGAYVSAQSSVIESRKELEDAAAAISEQYGEEKIPLPETWGGYLLTANKFEFWQGRLDRLHDRFVYLLDGDHWKIQRLAP